jgi:hypothetical protein
MSTPLTSTEIAAIVEHVVSSYEDLWIERGILDAPDDATAVRVAKERCGIGGFTDGDLYVHWQNGGIIVEALRTDDVRGTITFPELVRHVRHGITREAPQQLSLLTV